MSFEFLFTEITLPYIDYACLYDVHSRPRCITYSFKCPQYPCSQRHLFLPINVPFFKGVFPGCFFPKEDACGTGATLYVTVKWYVYQTSWHVRSSHLLKICVLKKQTTEPKCPILFSSPNSIVNFQRWKPVDYSLEALWNCRIVGARRTTLKKNSRLLEERRLLWNKVHDIYSNLITVHGLIRGNQSQHKHESDKYDKYSRERDIYKWSNMKVE